MVIWRKTYGKGPLSERGKTMLPHGLATLSDIQQVFSYIHTIPDSTYHGPCYTSREAVALTRHFSAGQP